MNSSLEGRIQRIEALLMPRPVNDIMSIIDAMRKLESMSPKDREKVRRRDDKFFMQNVEYTINNHTIDQVLLILKDTQ